MRRVREEHRRDQHRGRAVVHGGRQPLGQRGRGDRRPPSRTSIRPPRPGGRAGAGCVWNSPSVVTSRGRRASGSAERKRTTSSWVFWPERRCRPASRRAGARSRARTRSRSSERGLPLVVAARSASSHAAELAVRERTSGHAWCECPVSSSRSLDAEPRVVRGQRVRRRRRRPGRACNAGGQLATARAGSPTGPGTAAG